MRKIKIIQLFILFENRYKMNEILELIAPIAPIDTINYELDDTVDSFPEQTQRARAQLWAFIVLELWFRRWAPDWHLS